MLYLSFRWLHFVAVISWMAGILYLYRLLIYQAERGASSESSELLTLMARRLYRVITRPAMIVSFVGGLGMISQRPELARTGWFQLKFLCVLGIAGMTLYAGRLIGHFAEKRPNLPTSRRLRILNEVPTLLMMLLIAMAVFRPF